MTDRDFWPTIKIRIMKTIQLDRYNFIHFYKISNNLHDNIAHKNYLLIKTLYHANLYI